MAEWYSYAPSEDGWRDYDWEAGGSNLQDIIRHVISAHDYRVQRSSYSDPHSYDISRYSDGKVMRVVILKKGAKPEIKMGTRTVSGRPPGLSPSPPKFTPSYAPPGPITGVVKKPDLMSGMSWPTSVSQPPTTAPISRMERLRSSMTTTGIGLLASAPFLGPSGVFAAIAGAGLVAYGMRGTPEEKVARPSTTDVTGNIGKVGPPNLMSGMSWPTSGPTAGRKEFEDDAKNIRPGDKEGLKSAIERFQTRQMEELNRPKGSPSISPVKSAIPEAVPVPPSPTAEPLSATDRLKEIFGGKGKLAMTGAGLGLLAAVPTFGAAGAIVALAGAGLAAYGMRGVPGGIKGILESPVAQMLPKPPAAIPVSPSTPPTGPVQQPSPPPAPGPIQQPSPAPGFIGQLPVTDKPDLFSWQVADFSKENQEKLQGEAQQFMSARRFLEGKAGPSVVPYAQSGSKEAYADLEKFFGWSRGGRMEGQVEKPASNLGDTMTQLRKALELEGRTKKDIEKYLSDVRKQTEKEGPIAAEHALAWTKFKNPFPLSNVQKELRGGAIQAEIVPIQETGIKMATVVPQTPSAGSGEDLLAKMGGKWPTSMATPRMGEALPTSPIPDVGGQPPSGNLPSIPKMERGGIVTKPTMAMVGEKGPEAVLPLKQSFMARGDDRQESMGGPFAMKHHTIIDSGDESQEDGMSPLIAGMLPRGGFPSDENGTSAKDSIAESLPFNEMLGELKALRLAIEGQRESKRPEGLRQNLNITYGHR